MTAETHIQSKFTERYNLFSDDSSAPTTHTREYVITTEKKVPSVGLMLVGLGGNNGSTFVAGLLANKRNLKFNTKRGELSANFYGSFT